ncbi:MAG: hypothetical protein ACTHW1_00410 [Ancrocorticia sp.]|uniref:hypothetical protein n=1 Tax=Ancrocorticia sp. TaxID=2593684 RepID=UPI003F8E356E
MKFLGRLSGPVITTLACVTITLIALAFFWVWGPFGSTTNQLTPGAAVTFLLIFGAGAIALPVLLIWLLNRAFKSKREQADADLTDEADVPRSRRALRNAGWMAAAFVVVAYQAALLWAGWFVYTDSDGVSRELGSEAETYYVRNLNLFQADYEYYADRGPLLMTREGWRTGDYLLKADETPADWMLTAYTCQVE